MMLCLAVLYLAAREWLPVVAAGMALALIIVSYGYFRTPGSRIFHLGCAGLKLAGIALLLACLLEPMKSEQRAKPGANLFAVIADISRSMKASDYPGGPSRAATASALLQGPGAAWMDTLRTGFDLRGYGMDTRLVPVKDFSTLRFDGTATLPAPTLAALAERHRGQPLAGALWLTDGVVDDLRVPDSLAGVPPIYPVLVAGKQAPPDVSVGEVRVNLTAFEDAPVTVEAVISAPGFAGREVVAKLTPVRETAGPFGNASEPIVPEPVTVKIPHGTERAKVRVQFHPSRTGVFFYRLQVTPKADAAEATTENNEVVVAVQRSALPQPVLYVSGRPNWDFKFLNRAMQADEQIQLLALIRIAKREPKFDFRGRSGESSNPLFRGFGDQDKEDIERYDQPVLVRIGVENERELAGGFPKTEEELFRYRAVILDDLEAAFFTSEQQTLLQKYVSERGGGLLMMGGAESFREGRHARTPLGEMLPVYLRDRNATSSEPGPWRMALTREGWLQPWLRLRSSEAEERVRFETLPVFDVLNSTGGVKPGSITSASVSNGESERAAIVTQRFGRGRTAALLIGDFFQAGLGDEARQKDLLRAWRQIIRWLVADVPDAVELRAEPSAGRIRLVVTARDKAFTPRESSKVSVAIASHAAPTVLLPAEPMPSEPGVYFADFVPRTAGGYRAEATVQDEKAAVVGVAETGWASNLAAEEFRNLQPNVAALERIAAATGGRVLRPAELPAFARELPKKKAPITETITHPLWHTPWVLGAALLCLLGEWSLRRWKGLA